MEQPEQPETPQNPQRESEPTPKKEETKKEININKPKDFTGDRTKVQSFLQDCISYMHLNRHIYNHNEAKVAFVLSFLNDKEAEKWKETYRAGFIMEDGDITYPTFKSFIADFTNYFRPINQVMVANSKIATLRQGKRTVEEYVAEFRLLSSLAGMTSDSAADNLHLINYFRWGLHPAISRKIALSDTTPTTISRWADRAVQYDTNFRMETEFKKGFGFNKNFSTNYNTLKQNTPQRDPYAMDIDAMTTEE